MKKSVTKRFLTVAGLALLFTSLIILGVTNPAEYFTDAPNKNVNIDLPETQKLERVEKKAARSEYFFKLLRDPATNQIPQNIRNRELEFARHLPSSEQAFRKAKGKDPNIQAIDFNWQQAGPFDVGGRTRALSVDQRNSDIILAGGVSGGMWKSIDSGETWNLKTPDLPNLSVTSVDQDPTDPDTWYYASGEVIGNSASANNSAPYYGQGIYKSTDNGETWSLMPQASSNTQGLVDPFNTVSRIRVNPNTGTVFIASTGFGIYRSTDGESFSDGPVLGTEGEQLFSDVAVASDGTVAAVLSEADFDDQQSQDPSNNHNPGVFISNDDGENWTEVTPGTFPDTHRRSVLTFAPSNPDILYVFTLKGANDTDNQGVSFHHIDLNAGEADDRSANLPDFREDDNDTGYINPQGGYNMIVDVKPDNEDYVFIGATNLFRSDDGFATAPSGGYDGSNESQKDEFWIGGYRQDNSPALYPNQHPDQHIMAFPEPNSNPDLMWAGHDGGLSFTDNLTASEVSWEDRDRGYITSQFYALDIPSQENDNRLVGGTQDNGSPFFEQNGISSQNSQDISSGDGGYAYFTNNYIFSSSQNGRVIRWESDLTDIDFVSPINAENQLFIHTYVVDPNDEDVMYYPEGNHIWRNTTMNQISNKNNGSGTSTGWDELENVNVGPSHVITALEVSQNPGNILYFAGFSNSQSPEIRRLINAKSSTEGATDISLPDEYQQDLEGAYVKDIAINPVNANEVIVVLSNYNITGLYHTTDGGDSWDAIEGNLTGNSTNPGVSLRSAAMIPAESGTIYLVGTSTGVYSTQLLDGDNTTWGQESSDGIGNAIAEHLASRVSDGDVAVGTHGRGIFTGDFQGNTDAPFVVSDPSEGQAGATITLIANDFEFNSEPSDNEVTFGDTPATVISGTTSELQVEVPRDVLDRQASSRSTIIQVDTGNETISTSFRILPPNNFAIEPNYPNPFNASTSIPFDVPSESRVTIAVYNITGQKVREPVYQDQYNAGTYDAPVDLSDLASGVYIYRVVAETAGGETYMESDKMTLIK